uniref:DDE_Tnp_ISL3 domain-containing protein n=1 Tax=Syphacia muris TaxID=451379 RepID=A0A0N5B198_9BILA
MRERGEDGVKTRRGSKYCNDAVARCALLRVSLRQKGSEREGKRKRAPLLGCLPDPDSERFAVLNTLLSRRDYDAVFLNIEHYALKLNRAEQVRIMRMNWFIRNECTVKGVSVLTD